MALKNSPVEDSEENIETPDQREETDARRTKK